MNADERSMIQGLFERLRQAEAHGGPRDVEADALIRQSVADQPAAPYLMAQVVLVQEQALRNLQSRVEELERELAERPQEGGGFLGGLFGASTGRPDPAPARSRPPAMGLRGNRLPAQGAGAGQPGGAQGQGGGFMAGAMQTAMGVAGGVLLANAIGGLFAGEEAQAAELPADVPEETGDDEGLFGGFFGDGGEDDF
jgi:hypothetical protein